MKIIDCFSFYNERSMLKYRLSILSPVVDYFILVEATLTHKGNPKQLYFQEDDVKEYADKIIRIVVDDMPCSKEDIDKTPEHAWVNEKYQRNAMARGIAKLNLQPKDLLIISDLDEIPDPESLRLIKKHGFPYNIVSIHQQMYYYNLRTLVIEAWQKPKLLTYETYQSFSDTSTIRACYTSNILSKGGWHLSYFGDSQFIQNKLQQFAHYEYSGEEYTNLKTIQSRIDAQVDLFGRFNHHLENVPIKNNTYLPPRYEEFLSDFL